MTGTKNKPEELREKISQLIRYEMKSMPTASLARIKDLDEDTRRATVETVPDGATETNVPVAAPFASDGVGDITPLNPEVNESHVKGVVLYVHHPLEQQLAGEDLTFDAVREHDEQHAIFLPAMLWFDADEVPDHEPGERQIGNPDGNTIQMDSEGASVRHSLGAFLRAAGNPAEEFEDVPELEGIKSERDEEEDFRTLSDGGLAAALVQWPEGKEGESWFEAGNDEPDRDFTITRRGAAFEQGEGAEVSTRPLNDGERQVLDGPHQHIHPIQHDDGTVSLAGPPLSFREFIAWMLDEEKRQNLRNPEAYSDARVYARNYLNWLEDKLGREIDPSDPASWPDPQPMPTASENAGFSPSVTTHTSVAAVPATADGDAPVPNMVVEGPGKANAPVTAATSSAPVPSIGGVQSPIVSPSVAGGVGTARVPSITAEVSGYGEDYGSSYGTGI